MDQNMVKVKVKVVYSC